MKSLREQLMVKIILISLLMIVLCAWGGINWDTHDDPIIALILYRYGAENTPFVNHLYLLIFDVLYSIFPKYNWWLIASIAEIIIAMYVYIYILGAHCKKKYEMNIFMLLFILSTYYFALRQINFTRTACYVANAGLILFLLSLHEMQSKYKKCKLVLGFLLYILGVGIRLESALLAIPIACMVILFCVHIPLKRRILRFAGMVFMFVAVCVALELANRASMSENMRNWNDILQYKRILSDYPVELEQDADISALSVAGISFMDIEFAKGFFFTYKKVFNSENLKLLCDNVKVSIDIEFLYNEICLVMKYSSMIWFFILGILLLGRKKTVLVLYVVLIILMESYWMLIGRCPLRVFDSILFMGTVDGLIYSYLMQDKEMCEIKGGFERLEVMICVGLAAILFLKGNVQNLIDKNMFKYVHQMTNDELDAINLDKEHIYVMMSDAFVALAIPDNIFFNYDVGYCDNMVYQDGFFSDLPIFDRIFEKYHVQDAVELMYSSSDVYGEYSEKSISFLAIHGCNLYVTDMRMCGNTRIVQYSSD